MEARQLDREALRQASTALACLSPDCLSELLAHLQDVDGPEDVEANSLVIWPSSPQTSEPGCRPCRPAQNEAQFLGVALPAGKMCNGQSAKVLSRPDFLRTLAKFPAELKIFERFAREAAVFVGPAESWQENMQDEAGKRLLAFLEAGNEFQGCEPEFLMTVLANHMVSGRLLAPGSTLQGNAWYVVLAGRVQVESPDGLLLRYAGPGEVLSLENSLVLRAVRGKLAGPALCLELSQPSGASGAMGSENVERWRRNVQQLRSEERETLERRRSWVQKVAVPALSSTQLLAGCPEDFLQLLAGQLSEEAFQEHQEIIGCNTEGDSMLVLLEGLVELRAKSGKQVGCISPGAVLGEPEALGLLSYRTATAKAVTDCRLMPVSFQALTNALEHPDTPQALKEGFQQLVEGRRKQVEDHKPLAGLMHLRADREEDVGANLLALRAERLPLESGDCWQPSGDSEACGPRLSLILRGRVELSIGSASGPPVEFHVRTGSVVPEGMLATSGAVLRALSADCEVYRLWHFDLLQAAFITPQAPDWFYQLRVLEEETRGYLQSRLSNARGLVQGRWRHPTDVAIRGRAEKKRENLRRAQKRQEQFYENYLGPKLPLLPPKKLGTTAFRSWGELPAAKPTKPQNRGPSPSAFRALKLHRSPRSRSESQLRR